MRKLKWMVSVFLIMSLIFVLAGCSDESTSDKSEKKEITREDEMKENKSIYMVTGYKDEAGMYHYCGIDGEGKLVEFTSEYTRINDFYKGYAIANKSGKAYLIDTEFNVIFEADDMEREYPVEDYIIYKNKETSKEGCIRYDGKVLTDAKYRNVEVHEYIETNNTYYNESSGIVIECDKDDATTDYYNVNGLFLFNGGVTNSYMYLNYRSNGFMIIGDPAMDRNERIYYSYHTGDKLDQIKVDTYNGMKGPIYKDKKNKKYVLYDNKFNVIKEIPMESEGKKYENEYHAKKRFWLSYNDESKTKIVDVYSSETGELLYTINNLNNHSTIYEIYDHDNNEYLVCESKTEDGINGINIYDEKGNIVYTNSEDYQFVESFVTFGFFSLYKDGAYYIYSLDGFKQISSVGFNRDVDDENRTYVFLSKDNRKGLYIDANGKYYEFDLTATDGKYITVDKFLLYDYIILKDVDNNRYVVDVTTGNVTFEFGDDTYYTELTPHIRIDDKYYDYNGNLIVDRDTYGK